MRRERPWDCAIASETACKLRKRRITPDGKEIPVVRKNTAKGERFLCPWSLLNDGDFFFVPFHGSKNSMQVAFRQAAVRHDIEITIREFTKNTDEGPVQGYQVCRIIGGIKKIKAAARERGVFAPCSDVNKYYKRQHEWKKAKMAEEDPEDMGDIGPAMSIAPTPETPAPAQPGRHATAPLGADAQRRYDREALMAERLRLAKLELAGLDPETDEDFMGVAVE